MVSLAAALSNVACSAEPLLGDAHPTALRDGDGFSLEDTDNTANKNAIGRIFVHAPTSGASSPNNYRYCAGTLVSPTLVLTAARCVDPFFTAQVARDDGDVVTLTEPAFVGFGPCGDRHDALGAGAPVRVGSGDGPVAPPGVGRAEA